MDREDVYAATARERCRIADLIDGLDEAQLASPSLCAGWDVKTAAAHLVSMLMDGPGAVETASEAGIFRVQALASRGRLWTPANGSDQPPEQKASPCAGAATISVAATAALVPSAPGVSSRA